MSTELAWAAGFFDGEGNVGFSRPARRRPRIHVQVAQVHRSPLDRFLRAVGHGTVNGPYIPKAKTHSPYHQWTVEGLVPAKAIFALLGPYLDQQKTEAFHDAIAKYEAWLADPRCWKGHPAMVAGDTGRLHCRQCKSDGGRKGANARWASKSA